jgi:hypothetical protein
MCRVHEGDIMHVVHIVGRQTPNLVGPDHSTAYMKFKNTAMNDIQEVKAERVRCAATLHRVCAVGRIQREVAANL